MARPRARTLILDRGLELVSVEGLHGTTIGRLAKHVGMSKSGLYAHFSSKEALQLALVDRTCELLARHVIVPALEQGRGQPRLVALFDNWLAWASGEVLAGGCLLLAASFEYDDRPGPIQERLISAQRDWIECLAAVARELVGSGEYRADLDWDRFAFDAYGILAAFHLYHRLLGESEASQWARDSFSSLCHAARLRH